MSTDTIPGDIVIEECRPGLYVATSASHPGVIVHGRSTTEIRVRWPIAVAAIRIAEKAKYNGMSSKDKRDSLDRVSPPPGFFPMSTAPEDGTVVILACVDEGDLPDFLGLFDFSVRLARCSMSQNYVAWLWLHHDPNDPGDCNHGAIAYPIGWMPVQPRRAISR